MIAPPSLREVLERLRALGHPVPEDAEGRWAEVVLAEPSGPPRWLDPLLFLGGWLLVGLLACGCFPIWSIQGVPVVVGLLGFVGAAALRWALPSSGVGRVAAPSLFAVALSARIVLLIGLGSAGLGWTLVLASAVVIEAVALLAFPGNAHRALTTVTLGLAMLGLLDALNPSSLLATTFTVTGSMHATVAAVLELIRDLLLGAWLVLAAVLVVARPYYASTPLRHLLEPMSHGLAILGLAGSTRFWAGWADESFIPWVGLGTGGFALLVVGVCLARVKASGPSWGVALLGAGLVVLLGLPLPGLSASLTFVLLALLVRDPWHLGIAVISLILFGIWAYVELELPVLLKGGALFGSGCTFLALRAWMRWRLAEVSP